MGIHGGWRRTRRIGAALMMLASCMGCGQRPFASTGAEDSAQPVVALDAADVLQAAPATPLSGRLLLTGVRTSPSTDQVRQRALEEMESSKHAAIAAVADCLGRSDLPGVRISTDGLLGPSAGLMFAVRLLDLLTEQDLVAGRTIAGTGTIASDGRVGRVGSVAAKTSAAATAGADTFLVPSEQAAEAVHAPMSLHVVGVETLDATMRALGALDGCPAAVR